VNESSPGFGKRVVVLAAGLGVATALLAGGSPAVSSTPTPNAPISVTILPSGEGWMVSADHCAKKACAQIERTRNGGVTWTSVRLPKELQSVMNASVGGYYSIPQLSIYFSNAHDGWIYGASQGSSMNASSKPVMWSTHDAGKKWSAVPTKSLGIKFNILSMDASMGQVYAIGWKSDETFGIWRSSITSDSWQRVDTPALYSAAGGTTMEGALVFKGANGWLMVGNDRGVSGSARLAPSGAWVKWNAPCDKVGGGYDVPVANSATSLVDVCSIGGYGESVMPGIPRKLKVGTNWIFSSSDGGRTFVPTNPFGNENTTRWLDGVAGLPASPAPGVIFAAKTYDEGQISAEHLFSTRNGGKTWTSVYTPSSPSMDSIRFVTFASPRLGFAIVDSDTSRSMLIVSTNGGRTWHRSNTAVQ
jgi:hypothetical protein